VESCCLDAVAFSVEGLDTRRASVARVYDYWLGGRDNFAVDRRVGEAVRRLAPWVVPGVRANRGFLVRAVTWLAELGVDQFLDVGSGLPTMNNVHEAAQRVNPACRVVYVDNDPVVLAHARALLTVRQRSWVVDADLRDPVGLVNDPVVRDRLDWSRPVAILLAAVILSRVGGRGCDLRGCVEDGVIDATADRLWSLSGGVGSLLKGDVVSGQGGGWGVLRSAWR
jgi:S-adenosyl methyltransferase